MGRVYRRPDVKNRSTRAGWAVVFTAIVLLAVVLAVLAVFFVQQMYTKAADGAPGISISLVEPPGKTQGPPYVIALDAGHGGKDVGAEGIIQEVVMNERTVQLLYDMLAENDLFQPVLTRQMGEGATIQERVDAANQAGAHLLLSIHGNSDNIYGTYGFECFPAPPGRTWHDGSLRFATALAGQMGQAGARLRGEGGVRYIYYQNGSGADSAKVIREVSDTNVYDDPSFGIVEKPNCPAVLVEQCFITHQGDYDAFGTEEGCRVSAECYYRAICEYYGV